MILEACIESVSQAIKAEKSGANRIELCSDLHLDGLTPSEALYQEVRKSIQLPIHVMIRPREGGFTYSYSEFQEMKNSIRKFKELNADGLVGTKVGNAVGNIVGGEVQTPQVFLQFSMTTAGGSSPGNALEQS